MKIAKFFLKRIYFAFLRVIFVVYRLIFWPILKSVFGLGDCRFYPSCSCYAETAIKRFGFFYGMILSIKRILRCNPYSKGGFDPVPEKK